MLTLLTSLVILLTSVFLAIHAFRSFGRDNDLTFELSEVDENADNVVMLNNKASLDYQACSLLREYAEIQALPPSERVIKLAVWQKRVLSWQRIDSKRMDSVSESLKPSVR